VHIPIWGRLTEEPGVALVTRGRGTCRAVRSMRSCPNAGGPPERRRRRWPGGAAPFQEMPGRGRRPCQAAGSPARRRAAQRRYRHRRSDLAQHGAPGPACEPAAAISSSTRWGKPGSASAITSSPSITCSRTSDGATSLDISKALATSLILTAAMQITARRDGAERRAPLAESSRLASESRAMNAPLQHGRRPIWSADRLHPARLSIRRSRFGARRPASLSVRRRRTAGGCRRGSRS